MRNLDVAAELTRLGIDYIAKGKDEWRIRCPYHEDNHPSCDISQVKQNFLCRSCHVTGDIYSLFTKLTGLSRHVLLSQFESSTDKPVEASVVQRYHQEIWTATVLLEALYKRGVSDDTIRRRLLGEHNGRVTIPIANSAGMFVNIRQYLPGATDQPKTINLRGRGTPPRLYPFDQLQYSKILLCGGEIKALAAIERLNEHGIGCLCLTAGENEWVPANDEYFRHKHLWICQDIDDTGTRSAEFRCLRLSQLAAWCGRVDLPLDIKKHPKGDLNDFLEEGGDLLACLEATPQFVGQLSVQQSGVAEDPSVVTIHEALSSGMVHKRFESKICVTAIGQDSYYIPKEVVAVCGRDQSFCHICPVFHNPPDTVMTINAESTGILSMIDTKDQFINDEVKKALELPECASVKFKINSRYKCYETRIQRAINLTAQDSDKTAVPAVLVDQETELNETYAVIGRAVPHPKTQHCVVVVSNADAVADALTGFKMEEPEELLVFQPPDWTVDGISTRIDSLYEEVERNITRIYDRRALHVLCDLAFHSVLAFDLDNHIEKGVLEILIVGDSSQGKSRATEKLMLFYGLGERVDCKNATVAGLIGGLEQIGGKWFVQWGVIPTNDRRLVVLEELKGMRPEVFSKLTDTRSSGFADIPKIIRGRSPARTRLIVNSNVRRRGATLSSYPYGVAAVMDLIQSPEDVRRFDAALLLNKNDLDNKTVLKRRPMVESTFTAAQARKLILWAWTRTVEQVLITEEAIDAVDVAYAKLTDLFSDEVPLIDTGSTKVKLTRLAAALAARTFSTDGSRENLVVRGCHVEWIERFICEEYSKPSHGYLEMSKRMRSKAELIDPDMVAMELGTLPDCEMTIEHILFQDEIDQQDIMDWCGWTADEAEIFVGKLVRSNCLFREGRLYRKTAAFTELLRKLKNNPPKRPEHTKDANPKY